jgi:hypothetical protein
MKLWYWLRRWAMVLGMTALGTAAWAQSVTLSTDTALRSEPRFDAAPVAQLKQGTAGEAGAKQGPWLNIKTAAGTGWVLTTHVSYGSAAASSSSGGGFNPFARPRTASATSTIGIRGFDKETIGNALGGSGSVNTQQLALLDSFAVDKAGGASFASGQGLQAASIQY